MENVKVNFTNKKGIRSVVSMPVNQFVTAAELKPDQYSLYKGKKTDEDYVDGEKIVKDYLDNIVKEPESLDLSPLQKLASLDAAIEALLERQEKLEEVVNVYLENPGPTAADFDQLKKDFDELKAKIQPVG